MLRGKTHLCELLSLFVSAVFLCYAKPGAGASVLFKTNLTPFFTDALCRDGAKLKKVEQPAAPAVETNNPLFGGNPGINEILAR